MKSIFSRHGSPLEVMSDNALYYKSAEFVNVAQEWGFKHTTSSQRFPKSNGLAESTVKTIKRILKKFDEDGSDPYLAMLNVRNTPVDGLASPAQLLMNRRLRSNLPVTHKQLKA